MLLPIAFIIIIIFFVLALILIIRKSNGKKEINKDVTENKDQKNNQVND